MQQTLCIEAKRLQHLTLRTKSEVGSFACGPALPFWFAFSHRSKMLEPFLSLLQAAADLIKLEENTAEQSSKSGQFSNLPLDAHVCLSYVFNWSTLLHDRQSPVLASEQDRKESCLIQR